MQTEQIKIATNYLKSIGIEIDSNGLYDIPDGIEGIEITDNIEEITNDGETCLTFIMGELKSIDV